MQAICQQPRDRATMARSLLLKRPMNESRADRVLEPALPRRVLLLGASGLMGSAVLARYAAEGVAVRAVARRPPAASQASGVEWRALELARLVAPGDWLAHLDGVDAVVNCAGALQGDLMAVHFDSARALYSACEKAGVRRVVHLSAIGVERGG